MDGIYAIQPLTTVQRERAREQARKALLRKVGKAPEPKQFMHQQMSKYPGLLRNSIIAFAVIICILGFVPSAIRIYSYASHEFYTYIPNEGAAILAAVALTLLAEATQIAFSLAAAMVHDADAQGILSGRNVFHALAWIATAFAIVGNISVVQPPTDGSNMFAWFDALWPPLLVLGAAYALKQQGLHAIEARYAGTIAYEQALQRWQDAVASIEDHAHWQATYIHALQDALRSHRRKDTDALAPPQLLQLAWREYQADDVMLQIQQMQQQMQAPAAKPVHIEAAQVPVSERATPARNNGQLTGEVVQALQAASDAGPVRVVCPHCAWEVTKDNKQSARLALTAHLRRHPEKQTKFYINGHVQAVDAATVQ